MKFATIGRQDDLSVSPSYFSHGAFFWGYFISRFLQALCSLCKAEVLKFASGVAHLVCAPWMDAIETMDM